MHLPSYLKSFDCKSKDLNSDFYYNVIRLISVYLKETTHYLVVVFDEYEHVFSWRSSEARKSLYQESLFIEKAIEESKRMSDRQFMKEVTANV